MSRSNDQPRYSLPGSCPSLSYLHKSDDSATGMYWAQQHPPSAVVANELLGTTVLKVQPEGESSDATLRGTCNGCIRVLSCLV